jgi:glycosyltransferase involved in cell wall biosynthesis
VAVARLTIGFDGQAIVSPAAGIRRYTRELFGAMVRLAPDIGLVAVGGPPAADLPPGISRVDAPRLAPTNLGRMLVDLPLAVRRARLDLFHAPAYVAPLVGVHPLALTIHDVSYERHPEWYPYRRDPLRRWFYRCSALAADIILTDSGFSRGEIHEAYGIPLERIAVVPLGVGPEFTAGPVDITALPGGVTPPYLLHVGDLHARRNLEVVVDAVCALRSRDAPLRGLSLVLAGADRGAGAGLVARAAGLGHPNAVRLIGTTEDAALVALYRAAGVFVYPSRYEGFGLPPLEAMACGTPVVAARAGSIPEVVGDAGVLVDPDDVRGFAAAIERVMISSHAAEAYRVMGLARAARFTWERTAALTLEIYGRLVGGRGR